METGWIQVITIIGANLIMFVSMIGLFIHTNKRIDDTLNMMHDEMKDFHARLCVIESKRHTKAND
jgi:hypothetical protein